MSTTRRAAVVAALLAAAIVRIAFGQGPVVAPALATVWQRDTTLSVWLFVRRDVPLDTAVAHIAAAGAQPRLRSRWLHAVAADAQGSVLRQLARDPRLRQVQPLGRWRRPTPPDTLPVPPAEVTAVDTCGPGGDPLYGPSAMPYRQLRLRPLADAGFAGAGVRLALLDTGFDTADPAFAGVTVAAERDFVFGDSVVRDEPADQPGQHGHGTAVWSLLAGDVPGRLRGITRAATYLLAKTEDIRSETRVEEDHFVAALEWADSLNAHIVSTSLGYLQFDNGFGYTPSDLNGDIAVTTVAVDSAAARGILVVSAAGNGGPGYRTLVTPADADSGLAAGAEDSLGTLASFSSRGPTADGRIKPDLTAPGVAVCALAGGGAVRRVNGTSFATPLLAGAAALVREAHPTLDPAALGMALRRAATHAAMPDTARGYGRPDVTAAAVFPLGVVPAAPLAGPASSITPTFAWTIATPPPFATPVRYRLRVARDASLASLDLDTVLATSSVQLPRALRPGPVWWQVDATAASGQSSTSGAVGPVEIPAWATLLTFNSPGGETTADSQPLLAWRSPAVAVPPGPPRYDVLVRRTTNDVPDVVVRGMTDTMLRVPVPLERSVTYTWTLIAHVGADSSVIPSVGTFLVLDPTTPPATLLYQNFPNPFPDAGGGPTCLWFDLSSATVVQLDILDLRGRLVRRLVPAPQMSGTLAAGRYGRGPPGTATCDPLLAWDGRAGDGRTVPAGVYLARLQAGTQVQFKRIVFRGGGP